MRSPGRPLVIALLGAECTGKSTLARQLARQRGALVVPEYLREFVADHGRVPRVNEQAQILAEQSNREERMIRQAAMAGAAVVVADPAVLMTAIYSSYYFDDDSLLSIASSHERRYDLSFWCAPDIEWEPDGDQRDGPGVRGAVDELLRAVVAEYHIQSVRLTGTVTERLSAANVAIDALRA